MALNWSFRARLYNTTEAMKQRYVAICDQLGAYKGVKAVESWGKVRVYKGRVNYALISFRGKTLCVALALDPQQYIDTKYIFDDMSDVLSLKATPVLVRVSSERQLQYLFELFDIVLAQHEKGEVVHKPQQLPYHNVDELIAMGLIKVTDDKIAVDEAEEIEIAEPVAQIEVEPVEAEPLPEVEEPATEVVEEPEPELEVVEQPEVVEQLEVVEQPQQVAPAQKVAPTAVHGVKIISSYKCIINLSTIDAHFAAGDEVSPETLKAKGLIAPSVGLVKILGDGGMSKPMTIAAHKFSQSAKEAIEAVGGDIVILSEK